MAEVYTGDQMLDMAEDGLRAIGYDDTMLRRNYAFANVLENNEISRIDIAAHCQEPPDYISACFGVKVLQQDGAEAIQAYRAFGAPQVIALYPHKNVAKRWKIVAHGKPILLETLKPSHLKATFLAHEEKWSPSQILRAKSGSAYQENAQLDFYDVGLLPAIEEVVHTKLDALLRKVDQESRAQFKEHHLHDIEGAQVKGLYRLIFRLVAAKLLADRGYPGDWANSNVDTVIADVNAFYFAGQADESILDHRPSRQCAWDIVRNGCQFQNISVEALAYVYENTFVTNETRSRYGTHATPQGMAEYIVQHLPLKTLPRDERRIFEPCAGAAPFLIAALKQLRALLKPGMDSRERHNYFVSMLSGMEIDAFACEIAKYSLILADYPNPAGWNLRNEDVFTSSSFDAYLQQANVVLCNPPYEDFSLEERNKYRTLHSINKAAETLHRVMRHPPKMLGFVLPGSFVDSRTFRDLRHQISSTYSDTSLIAIPDKVFRYSESDTVLLIAQGEPRQRQRRHSATVMKNDYPAFIRERKFTWEVVERNDRETGLWHTPLKRVWDATEDLPRLRDYAQIHRGLEYVGPAKNFVSPTPKPGYKAGIQHVRGNLEGFVTTGHQYLSTRPEDMRGNAHTYAWSRPKAIANAVRISRGAWTIVAAIDDDSLYCSQGFHGIWATGKMPKEVIAAILNGPVANAFVTTQRSSRHNQKQMVGRIPVPVLTLDQMYSIKEMVTEYHALRRQYQNISQMPGDVKQQCEKLLLWIDAAILQAYDLTPTLQNELLDRFRVDVHPTWKEWGKDYVERLVTTLRNIGDKPLGKQENRQEDANALPTALLDRYHHLLDRKFTSSLSLEETAELERVREQLDVADLETPLEQEIQRKSQNEHERRLEVLNGIMSQLQTFLE